MCLGLRGVLLRDRPDDLICLRTFFSLNDVELDGIAFFQGFIAFCLDRAEVNEYVRTAITSEKAVTFSIVEPLHSS